MTTEAPYYYDVVSAHGVAEDGTSIEHTQPVADLRLYTDRIIPFGGPDLSTARRWVEQNVVIPSMNDAAEKFGKHLDTGSVVFTWESEQ